MNIFIKRSEISVTSAVILLWLDCSVISLTILTHLFFVSLVELASNALIGYKYVPAAPTSTVVFVSFNVYELKVVAKTRQAYVYMLTNSSYQES